jgi:hypothetical protein
VIARIHSPARRDGPPERLIEYFAHRFVSATKKRV